MSDKITLSVEKRDILGSKVKNLRQQGLAVGNVYGMGESVAIQAPAKELLKLYEEVGESTVVYLTIGADKSTKAVLFDEVQFDPVTAAPLHFVLRSVNLKEKISAMVSIETTGELAAKDAVAILTRQEVEVEALPTDLPEGFIIDLGTLTNIGDEIKFSDLDYDHDKVELLVEDLDAPVLVVNEVKEEVEEVPEVTETETAEGAEGTAEDTTAAETAQESASEQ